MRLISICFWLLLTSSVLAQPAITGFTPMFGPVGTQVTISGSNFSVMPANNIVYFGGVRATVITASSNMLQVIVPMGATYQPITVTSNNLTAYSNEPFIITFKGCNVLSNSSFASPVEIDATSTFSYGAVINDLDNDGKPDVVTCDYPSGVKLYTNLSSTGNINFAPVIRLTIDLTPIYFDLGDLDGDGKADLCTSQGTADANSISVSRNTSTPGSISFGANTNYSINKSTIGIRIGDLDGDGKPDIAGAAPGFPDGIYILRNTSVPGTISFSALPPVSAAPLPYSIVFSDLDGDTKPEMVVSNAADSSVSIFKNTSTPGNISFAPRIDLPTGSSPRGIACGDLDGDGKPDIVVCNAQSGTLSIFSNASSPGNISFSPQINIAAGSYPYMISLTDLNGDGKPEIMVTNVISQNLQVYQNASTPGNFIFSASHRLQYR